VRQDSERVERLEQAIREAVPEWSLGEVVTALRAMRGLDFVAAVTVLAEIGDLSRFQSPRELMGYLGLVPRESSTGDTVNRGSITKAGKVGRGGHGPSRDIHRCSSRPPHRIGWAPKPWDSRSDGAISSQGSLVRPSGPLECLT